MKLKTTIHLQILIAFISIFLCDISQADCYDDAANYHSVNPMILKAIAFNESSFRANLTTRNTNGSVDIGLTGTNSIHLPDLEKKGIHQQDLYDPCKSIYVSAWLLRKKINRHGNTWIAIGAYHSETPYERDMYAEKIRTTILAWENHNSTN